MPETGGSLRHSLRAELEPVAARWAVCEMVPESWNPEDPDDIAYIENLHSRTRLYLHSLSLNALGDNPPDGTLERILAWRKRLGAGCISDHFSWIGAGGTYPGVFLPPAENRESIRSRVRRLRDRLGCEFVLENIALAGRSRDSLLRYHEMFVDVCDAESIPILLDVENVRLDSLVAGVEATQMLKIYANAPIHSYHIAGGDTDGEIADTHRHACGQESIGLLRELLRGRSAPVFYERDYELDAALIAAEVDRLDKELQAAI